MAARRPLVLTVDGTDAAIAESFGAVGIEPDELAPAMPVLPATATITVMAPVATTAAIRPTAPAAVPCFTVSSR
jgi:hypothetical protein